MADMGCSPSTALAFDLLVGKGLRDFQAAGIVGNLQQESGLNPRAFNAGENALGIAQWRFERLSNLRAFAAESGRDLYSLETQLEFLWHELQTNASFGLPEIMAATTVEAAAIAFQNKFERCGTCFTENRISYAKSALFACPSVQPPASPQKKSSVLSFVAGAAILAAVGYGAYRLVNNNVPAPLPPLRPRPEPFPVVRRIYPPPDRFDRWGDV